MRRFAIGEASVYTHTHTRTHTQLFCDGEAEFSAAISQSSVSRDQGWAVFKMYLFTIRI